MRRILIDEGLPAEAADLLRREGWDAVHVREVGLARADDSEILRRGREETRVCITLDRDFHAHLARASAMEPSVILLRIEGLKGPDLRDLLVELWPQIEHARSGGVAVAVTETAIRIRRLPLAR